MPKGYMIGHITVTNPDAYKEYVERDTPILEGFGAKFLVRGGTSETPEGPMKDRHVVIEFPTFEDAKKAYYSDAYQEVLRIRLNNAESDFVLVEGT